MDCHSRIDRKFAFQNIFVEGLENVPRDLNRPFDGSNHG